MRFLKSFTAAAVAISMTGTPVLAQSAAPLSIASSVGRSGAVTGNANTLRSHDYVSVVVVLVVLLSAYLVTRIDRPHSP